MSPKPLVRVLGCHAISGVVEVSAALTLAFCPGLCGSRPCPQTLNTPSFQPDVPK